MTSLIGREGVCSGWYGRSNRLSLPVSQLQQNLRRLGMLPARSSPGGKQLLHTPQYTPHANTQPLKLACWHCFPLAEQSFLFAFCWKNKLIGDPAFQHSTAKHHPCIPTVHTMQQKHLLGLQHTTPLQVNPAACSTACSKSLLVSQKKTLQHSRFLGDHSAEY